MNYRARIALWVVIGAALSLRGAVAQVATSPTTRPVVRVAALGALQDGGFWDAVLQRFEKTTGIHVESASTGNKDHMPELFRQGRIDVIVLPAGDAMTNLVADRFAVEAQPWMKTDLVLIGPEADPAGVKGSADMASAMKKIAENKSPFINHSSSGADQSLRSILEANGLELDPQQTTTLIDDHQRRVFQIAVDKNAYTLISRVPFKSGKLLRGKLALMVENDPHLERVVMVAVANPAKFPEAHISEARRFAAFLCADATQGFVGEFGKGKIDDRPLFLPLVQRAVGESSGSAPAITGEIAHPFVLDAQTRASFPRHEVHVKDSSGKEVVYGGIFLRDVLKQAGAPIGKHQMRGANLSLFLKVEATDGYSAAIALAELDDELAERSILLADQRNGEAISDKEGPLRLVLPQEARPARWLKGVSRISVVHAE